MCAAELRGQIFLTVCTQLVCHGQFYSEMVAGGTTGKMPQWVPYKTCDTPGGSCELEDGPLTVAANMKGCLDPWLPSDPMINGNE